MDQKDIALFLSMFILLSVTIILLYSSHRHSEQNKLRRSLIDKFGSAQDLGAFLQSEGGRRFIEGLTEEGPLASVLGSVQKGIILMLLGMGSIGASTQTNVIALMGLGMVLFTAGIGFLISATVTYFLSKRFGLLGKRKDS